MSRHFDYRFELDNIARGAKRDLADVVGQTVPWYVYDSANSVVDAIYDVGATPAGRVWKVPIYLPVIGAIKLEASEITNDEGFYTVDTLRLVFSADAARKAGIGDIIMNPDQHNWDRIVYENKVFGITQVRVRGVLTAGYAMCAVDATQVKMEELVNDQGIWQSFIPDDFV